MKPRNRAGVERSVLYWRTETSETHRPTAGDEFHWRAPARGIGGRRQRAQPVAASELLTGCLSAQRQRAAGFVGRHRWLRRHDGARRGSGLISGGRPLAHSSSMVS